MSYFNFTQIYVFKKYKFIQKIFGIADLEL
jgi:hypothetical protein